MRNVADFGRKMFSDPPETVKFLLVPELGRAFNQACSLLRQAGAGSNAKGSWPLTGALACAPNAREFVTR